MWCCGPADLRYELLPEFNDALGGRDCVCDILDAPRIAAA
jgi:hypothetical protein